MHGSKPTKTLVRTAVATVAAAALVTGLVQTAGATESGAARASATEAATAQAPAAPAGVPTDITTVSTGYSIPWGMHWLPDNSSALVTERNTFKVFKVTPTGQRTEVGTVPESQTTGGEGGLMGVAVDPNWASNHFVYFMHTSSEGNRIARMTYDGTRLTGYTALLKGIAKNRYHNGGRLVFGPDGYLYATTGDAQNPSLAQDRNSLNGKILRMTTTGAPAPGNPFGNHVFSLGHRNPQGIAFDPQGRLWEAELGENARDELNLVKSGANYGWPICEGTCSQAGMTNPKATWTTAEASPSGIAVVDSAVYMASLRGERLWRIPVNAGNENVGTPQAHYVGTYGRLRGVTKVPGAKALWLSTTNVDSNGGEPAGSDKIFRVTIG
ncbi:PQQ-dependent sugar dehydrogenase [Streptomyces niveus]|uniref:PQQ-dependent sugar dehydrogenase n=1 Tax=Streptomyces niveus TaxID=193462 RepID=UPI003717D879